MSQRQIIIELAGVSIRLDLDSDGGGSITSNLRHWSLAEFLAARGGEPGDQFGEQFTQEWYEGAVDALESLILAAANSGIDVKGDQFTTALQTTLDAIGNNL